MTRPVSAPQVHATTIRIPGQLYDQAKQLIVNEKAAHAKAISLNDFFVTAIQSYVKLHERRATGAAMADDASYQQVASLLTNEFEAGDWQALRLGESHGAAD
jgi:hypothetical protein